MGLLDWLTSDIGGGATGVNGNPMMPSYDPMGNSTGPQASNPVPGGGQSAPPSPPIPTLPGMPSQQPYSAENWQNPLVAATNSYASPGSGSAGLPYPPGGDPMTAGGTSGNGPDRIQPPQDNMAFQANPLTISGQTPLPMARPPGAPGPSSAPAIPPPAAPGIGGAPGAAPTAQPQDLASVVQAGGQAASPTINPTAPMPTSLLNALGIDPNRAKEIKGALAGGLQGVAANWNKPGLAAFSGAAGAGIEGGNKASDKIEDRQTKALQSAIAAAQAGDTSALNKARTQLALAQAEAAKSGTGKGSKASVLNTQEQLYLRGLGAVNNDPQVKASAAQLRAMATQGVRPDSPEYKAAQEAHNKLIDHTKKTVFGTLGVNEKTAGEIAKKPGFSQDNPVPKEGLTKEKFDQLPPGAYFTNPADGRVLIKRPPEAAYPTPAAPTATPAVPVTAPAGSLADSEE